MPKYVAICLTANLATYNAELFARVGQNYDHQYESISAMNADGVNIGWDTTVYGGLEVECYNDWPTNGLIDRVDFQNWTGNPSSQIGVVISTPPNNRHNGTLRSNGNFSGFCWTNNQVDGECLRNRLSSSTGYLRLEGIILRNIASGGTTLRQFSSDDPARWEIDKCIFAGESGQVGDTTFAGEFGICYVSNCIMLNASHIAVYRAKVNFYNCSSKEGIYYMFGNNANCIFRCWNTIAHHSSSKNFNLTNGTYYLNNCISNDDSSDDYNGSGNIINSIPTYVDFANDDLHLDPSDTIAKDQGLDMSSDPTYPFDDDIDGDTRVVPWDIGADEVVGAAPTPKVNALFFGQDF